MVVVDSICIVDVRAVIMVGVVSVLSSLVSMIFTENCEKIYHFTIKQSEKQHESKLAEKEDDLEKV